MLQRSDGVLACIPLTIFVIQVPLYYLRLLDVYDQVPVGASQRTQRQPYPPRAAVHLPRGDARRSVTCTTSASMHPPTTVSLAPARTGWSE